MTVAAPGEFAARSAGRPARVPGASRIWIENNRGLWDERVPMHVGSEPSRPGVPAAWFDVPAQVTRVMNDDPRGSYSGERFIVEKGPFDQFLEDPNDPSKQWGRRAGRPLLPANEPKTVTVQSRVPGSGERWEGVAAVVGGDEFAQVGE